MQKRRFGIVTIIAALDTGILLIQQFKETMADGKFRFFETFGFVDDLKRVAEVIENREQLPKEFQDLTEEEERAIIQHLEEKHQATGENAVKLFAAAMKLYDSITDGIAALKK